MNATGCNAADVICSARRVIDRFADTITVRCSARRVADHGKIILNRTNGLIPFLTSTISLRSRSAGARVRRVEVDEKGLLLIHYTLLPRGSRYPGVLFIAR